jgi:hypothetical protein
MAEHLIAGGYGTKYLTLTQEACDPKGMRPTKRNATQKACYPTAMQPNGTVSDCRRVLAELLTFSAMQ